MFCFGLFLSLSLFNYNRVSNKKQYEYFLTAIFGGGGRLTLVYDVMFGECIC